MFEMEVGNTYLGKHITNEKVAEYLILAKSSCCALLEEYAINYIAALISFGQTEYSVISQT